MGGGAARGLAHVGVLKALQKEGIPVDMVAGTSTGAVVGALYAQGRDAEQIEKLVLEISSHKLAPLLDPSLPRTGLIKREKIKSLLASYIGGDIRFCNLEKPFACVAADINTGDEIVIDSGSVPEAVRASISIPGIFTVVRYEGRYLVDGSLVDPVPTGVLRKMGAEFIIGVNVIPDPSDRAQADKKQKGGAREPNIIHVIMQALTISTYSLVKASLEDADVVIEPQLAHIGAGDFRSAPECIRQGELATFSAVPEIKKKLARL